MRRAALSPRAAAGAFEDLASRGRLIGRQRVDRSRRGGASRAGRAVIAGPRGPASRSSWSRSARRASARAGS